MKIICGMNNQKLHLVIVLLYCMKYFSRTGKTLSVQVSRAVFVLKCAKSFLPRESLNLSTAHWYCGAPLWILSSAAQAHLNWIQFQKLHKPAARIVTNSIYNAPDRPLIEGLGWMTIQGLIQNESRTMVFKSLNGLAHNTCVTFSQKIQNAPPVASVCTTKIDLRLPIKKTANGQKCFTFRGAKLWNGLSAEQL